MIQKIYPISKLVSFLIIKKHLLYKATDITATMIGSIFHPWRGRSKVGLRSVGSLRLSS